MIRDNSTVIFFVTAWILVLDAVCPAQQQNVVEERMKMKTVVGEVSIRSSGDAKWRPARVGIPVKTGWEIRTFIESNAEIEFESGSIIKIGENTVLAISTALKNTKEQATRTGVDVKTGEIWANVKKLTNSKSRFVFETPTATAAIRGTRLGINVKEGKTRIDVYDGLVMVSKRGSGKSVPVKTRSRAIIDATEPEPRIIEFPADSDQGTSHDSATAGETPMIDPFQAGEPDTVTEEPQDSSGGQPADTIPAEPDLGIAGPEAVRLAAIYPPPDQVVEEKQLAITCQTIPGASAEINGLACPVGSDGYFSGVVNLTRGANSFPVSATFNEQTARLTVSVEFRPPLTLEVANLADNMEVNSQAIEVSVRVSDGARFSVNGRTNNTAVSLKQGANTITVAAWDEWGRSEEKSFTVIYAPETGFTLNVVSPRDGLTISSPLITVSGSTAPGANVLVNNMRATVGNTGFFTFQTPIPDEPGEYTITVSAESGGRELTVERSIVYAPAQEPLRLVITSPANGQVIRQRTIRIAGMVNAQARVTANDKAINVSPNGMISGEITVSEKEAGDYSLEISANSQDEDADVTLDLFVDVTSPQINTTAPVVFAQIPRATRNNVIPIQVVDRTPDEELRLLVSINGSEEEYRPDPGSTEQITIEEGKNNYSIRAIDRAGNNSNVLSGTVYCLPGPLTINIVEPVSNPYIIRGLPPMPLNTLDNPILNLEVEINDGIGTVPESIIQCRILEKNLKLVSNGDYTFSGEIEFPFGKTTVFTFEAEDMAGTKRTRTLTIMFAK